MLSFLHGSIFVLASVIGVIQSIMSLILGNPNPLWIVYFSLVAALLYTTSFALGISMRNDISINLLYFFHGIGAFTLALSALLVVSNTVVTETPYATIVAYGIIGTGLLLFGNIFLIHWIRKRVTTFNIILTVFVIIGTAGLFLGSIMAIVKFYTATRICNLVGFLALFEVGVQKLMR